MLLLDRYDEYDTGRVASLDSRHLCIVGWTGMGWDRTGMVTTYGRPILILLSSVAISLADGKRAELRNARLRDAISRINAVAYAVK